MKFECEETKPFHRALLLSTLSEENFPFCVLYCLSFILSFAGWCSSFLLAPQTARGEWRRRGCPCLFRSEGRFTGALPRCVRQVLLSIAAMDEFRMLCYPGRCTEKNGTLDGHTAEGGLPSQPLGYYFPCITPGNHNMLTLSLSMHLSGTSILLFNSLWTLILKRVN